MTTYSRPRAERAVSPPRMPAASFSLSPKGDTPPHASARLPTSPHISPHLPTSPRISPTSPDGSQSEGMTPKSAAAETNPPI